MKKNHREWTSLRMNRLTYSALLLAVAMVLPFVTGQIPEIGAMLSPMHIPVFLCGFLCGWPWGLAVGFVAPVLRSVLFGMPKLFPTAIAMTFELAAYGCFTGWLYRVVPRRKGIQYAVLIAAMIAGRVVWGLAQWVLLGTTGGEVTLTILVTDAVINVIPGIILHIALIPLLVIAMERAGLSLNRK